MKTSNKNYKILVLSDLKEPITNVLKSTISLAKIIGADIQFFHVKRAAEIVETENQLSAMRKINREYITTDKKIRKEVFSFSSNFDVSINYAFSFGNVKEEIVKYIKDYKPDVIVLGKRKKNPLSIIGDNVTQLLDSATSLNITGEVSDWSDSDKILGVIHVGSTDGLLHTFVTNKPLTINHQFGGDSDGFTIVSVTEDNKLSATEQNDDFSTESLSFLDFSEDNPFGDPENS